jgi:nitrite reductase/ring-hydroxylating ferredoxin subunit
MIKKILVLSLLLSVAFYFGGCKKDEDRIPYVYVDAYVSVSDPNFSALNAIGGWVYITGGSKGILLYRYSTNTFMAYDRHCPYNPNDPCSRVIVDPNSNLLVKDDCCGSVFLITDGSPNSGPATKALLRYQTSFDGNTIHIYN